MKRNDSITELISLIKMPDVSVTPIKRNFSFADKMVILNDFCQELSPEFAYDKSIFEREKWGARFSKLNGPLLMTFSIDFRSNNEGAYCWFEFNILNLCASELRYSFVLPMRDGSDLFWLQHKKYYKLLVQYIKKQSDITPFRAVTLDEIAAIYMKCTNFIPGNDHKTHCYELAIIASWAGEEQKAKEYLDWGCEVLQNFYNQESTEIDRLWKSKEANSIGIRISLLEWLQFDKIDHKTILKEWYDKHKAMIDNPEALRKKVRDNVKEHNFSYAPYRDLIGVAYQENNLPNPKLK